MRDTLCVTFYPCTHLTIFRQSSSPFPPNLEFKKLFTPTIYANKTTFFWDLMAVDMRERVP